MARGAMKAAISAARGAREQPNRTPIPRDGGGKGSVYPPQGGGDMQAKPLPGIGPVQDGMQRNPANKPRFIARPTPQPGVGGEQNSGGMVNFGPPMKGPRPEMGQVDVQQPNPAGGVSRSFPPSSGPIMDPRMQPGFLPPRLQKQVAAGNMTQAGAENRFQMFQQGQLPGQQPAVATPRGQMGGMAPGGEQMDEALSMQRGGGPQMGGMQSMLNAGAGMAQQFGSIRNDGGGGMGGMMGAGQPPGPMQAGGAAGMGVQMQNPAFRDQLKQMLQQRMAGAQPGGGGGGPFGGAPPRYMA